MSFSTPPSPSSDEENRITAEDTAAKRRKQDEWVAVVVALVSMGGILSWSMLQNNPGFDLSSWSLSPSPTATAPVPGLPTGDASGSTPAIALKSDPSPLPSVKPPTPTPIEPGVAPTAAATLVTPLASPSTAPTVPAPTISPNSAVSPSPTASVPAASPPTPKATISFADVPAGYWALPYIQDLGKRGILEGSGGEFLPDRPVTRAEFAAMLQKAFFDQAPVRAATDFKDVLPSYWGLPAIREAVKLGFMSGYTDGNFRATKPIPKLEGIVAMAAGLQLPKTSAIDVTQVYQDASRVPKWAIASLASATEAGLVVNYPTVTTLNPSQPLTRADAAALIYQALVKQGKAPAIASNYVAKP